MVACWAWVLEIKPGYFVSALQPLSYLQLPDALSYPSSLMTYFSTNSEDTALTPSLFLTLETCSYPFPCPSLVFFQILSQHMWLFKAHMLFLFLD